MYRLYQSGYPPGDVDKYADETGGMVVTTSRGNASERLAALIDPPRARYNLGYLQPTGREDGKFRRIQAEISPRVEQGEGQSILRTGEDDSRTLARHNQSAHLREELACVRTKSVSPNWTGKVAGAAGCGGLTEDLL